MEPEGYDEERDKVKQNKLQKEIQESCLKEMAHTVRERRLFRFLRIR
jgi:hypothetical protein